MFLFTFHAVPDPTKPNAEFADTGGAYVCAYVNFPEEKGAELLARYYIKDAGWVDGDVIEEVQWIDDVEPSDEIYQYFKEALEYGSSFVFHQYSTQE